VPRRGPDVTDTTDDKANGGDNGDAPTPPPPPKPPVWHDTFAIVSFLIVAAGFIWYLTSAGLWSSRFGLSHANWAKLSLGTRISLHLVGPIALAGVVAVLIGIWMVVVEWRGHFVDADTPDEPERVNTFLFSGGTIKAATRLITAIGKLSGGTLLLVIGGILLFGSAWVGYDAVRHFEPSTHTRTTSTVTKVTTTHTKHGTTKTTQRVTTSVPSTRKPAKHSGG
jgi:hypothetical protein